MRITAIVLAGGRSRRFEGDKLAADLGGETVLAATIRAVAPLADLVVVAGPGTPDARGADRRPADGLAHDGPPLAVVQDAEPFAGPLVALANVLEDRALDLGSVAIVVGGDMPRLVARVLVALVETLDVDPTVEAALLGRPAPDGRRPVLPLALRVDPATRAARETVAAGERSLQAFVDRLVVAELRAERWLALDPQAATLLDVDTRADLDRLR